MNLTPIISIIVPYHNSAKRILRTLESIYRQKKNYPLPFEVILTNNLSTDDSTKIVAHFIEMHGVQSTWKMIDASDKKGTAYAQNVAIKHTHGEWLTIIDSDDWVDDGYLAGFLMHSRENDLLIASINWWDSHKPKMITTLKPNSFQPFHDFPPLIISAGVFVRKKLVVEAGGWNENFLFAEDCEMMMRVILSGVFPHYINTPAYNYCKVNSAVISYKKGLRYGTYAAEIFKLYYPLLLTVKSDFQEKEIRKTLKKFFFKELKECYTHRHWCFLERYSSRLAFFRSVKKMPAPGISIAEKFSQNNLPFPNLDEFSWSFWKTKVPPDVSFLSFDDGPHPEYTTALLDLLKKHQQKATFFVVGKRAQQFPQIIKRIVEEGHELGNHTFNHYNLEQLNYDKTFEEINQTQSLLEEIVGEEHAPKWFRAPYGVMTGKAKISLINRNMAWVRWTQETFDWKESASADSVASIVSNNGPQNIYDLHDDIEPHPTYINPEASTNRNTTVEAVKLILQEAEIKNIRYVTLSEAFSAYFKNSHK